jgi:excinuclease UvrABC nuclease subunit
MSQVNDILPFSLALETDALDAALAQVPGKWGVILLVDREGGPLQLICTRNMRAMLRRRFEPPAEPSALTKRIDYRALVGSIRWQRVDSELEMDLVYIDAARTCFPIHWRSLIPERRAFFVRIEPNDRFATFERIDDPQASGLVFGPFVDKTKADRWIDQTRDAFDLCRYHNILLQTPNGKACAYKQMNKCPAPCDGTVTLERYRENVDRAIASATDPKKGIADLTAQMKRFAAEMEFEAAGRVKSRIDLLSTLGGGAYRSIRPLGAFDYLSVQPGARKGTAKLFRVMAGGVQEIAGVRDEAIDLAELLDVLKRPISTSDCPPGVLLGAVCHYLGSTKTASRFLSLADLDEAELRKAIRAAMKVQPLPEDAETIRETALSA